MDFDLKDPFDVSFLLGGLLLLSWFIHALIEFRFLCYLGYHRARTFEIQHGGETVIFRACIRCGHPEGIPEGRGIGRLARLQPEPEGVPGVEWERARR